MPASKATPEVRLKTGRVAALAEQHGLKRLADIAEFLGVSPSNYSRVTNGVVKPGEDFIAAVLASHEDLNFDDLFEVVTP